MKLMTLKEYKDRRMKDPEFATAYEEMQPEMNVIRALIDARISMNMSQKELSEKTENGGPQESKQIYRN